MDRTVAIKVIHLGVPHDDTKRHFFLERFYRGPKNAGELGRAVHRDLEPANGLFQRGCVKLVLGKAPGQNTRSSLPDGGRSP